MPRFHVAKAVRSNPIFGRHLRWIKRYPEVLQALGCGSRPKTAVEFAECVAAWQSPRPLKDDGMLGPKTWAKLKMDLRSGAAAAPVPDWLKLAPEAEGWIDAIVATLRHDTTFIKLTHGIHNIRHKDFLEIADLVEKGDLAVVPLDTRGASYEFRNAEPDANTIKPPRRYGSSWRGTQALLIHEACHAISDLREHRTTAVIEESVAFVVQGMFLERHKVSLPRRDAPTEALRTVVRAMGRVYLGGKTADKDEWKRLQETILRHPTYRTRARAKLVFDGIPSRP